jgi:Zn-dependent peptidase ImmA (M78 family)
LNHYIDGVEVPPCSTADLRNLATRIRRMLGLSANKAFPVPHFIEYVLPIIYPDFILEVVSPCKMGNKHGETIPDKHIIRLREDVYEGMCNGNGQDRFTGMHECSHLIKHEGVPLALARRSARNLPAFLNSEWQADTLAAELLMPYETTRSMLPEDIKDTFLVSASAAHTRFDKLRKERRG